MKKINIIFNSLKIRGIKVFEYKSKEFVPFFVLSRQKWCGPASLHLNDFQNSLSGKFKNKFVNRQ